MSGFGSYDAYKLRSDRDDEPADVGELSECGTCEGLDGSHDLGCPDRKSNGDWVDAEIDGMKEGDR